MKKLITIACAFAVTLSVNAQDNTPKSGDWSVGTNAGPVLEYVGNLISGVATSPAVAFGENAAHADHMNISGKYFTDDMTAWRGSLDLYFTSDEDAESAYSFGVTAGKEFRKGTANLQGYYGYMANINMHDHDDETEIDFGAHGFIGVEYFVRPKMGIGAEYHHGLNYGDSNVSVGGSMGNLMLNLYF